MRLQGDHGLLMPHGSTGIVAVIVREEPHPSVAVEGPAPGWYREPDLGLERPAVGAKIDQLGRIVLADRRGDGEAGADDRTSRRAREFGGRHRLGGPQGQLEIYPGVAHAAGRA